MRQSTTPALPALAPEAATLGRATQRIALRRSAALRAALGAFVLIATLAVHGCLAAHLGTWRAAPLTFAAAALLGLCAARYDAAQPVALQIGPDGLSAWNGAGVLLAQGRVAGCAQWANFLLVLVLQPEGRGTRAPSTGFRAEASTLLLPADALATPVFRELSVLGRRAAGV
jgi:hypothetical protein